MIDPKQIEIREIDQGNRMVLRVFEASLKASARASISRATAETVFGGNGEAMRDRVTAELRLQLWRGIYGKLAEQIGLAIAEAKWSNAPAPMDGGDTSERDKLRDMLKPWGLPDGDGKEPTDG